MILNSVQYDYFQDVAGTLVPLDLSRLMDTQNDIRAFGQHHTLRRFKHLLLWYNLEPEPFREFMREHGVLIGGLEAIAFVRGRDTNENRSGDLRLYMHRSAYDVLMDYLPGRGYEVQIGGNADFEEWENHPEMGVESRIRFRRLDPHGQLAYVEVVLIRHRYDIIRAIGFSSNTAEMTYLTADSAHCLFPQLTLFSKALILFQGFTPTHAPVAVANTTPPQDLDNKLGEDTRKLVAEGFDVRYAYAGRQRKADCEWSCPSIRVLPRGQSTFCLVFAPDEGKKAVNFLRGMDELIAHHALFIMGGLCQNGDCENWEAQ